MTEVEKRTGGTDALTARINAKYREVECLARSTVEAGIELGGMLVEKKESLGHGEWLPWLKEYFDGSERHAQRFMKLYSQRDKLLTNPSRVSDLSLRGAFKEIAAPRKELPTLPTQDAEGTFENVVELVTSFKAIRDRELYRAKGYDTFDDYIKGEFPERAERFEVVMEAWEPVVDNPPPELRGAMACKAKELIDRLCELATVPEPGSGLTVAGRQLREIEERELYKLLGYRTFSGFCREHLALPGKYQTLFALAVELADIDPFFNVDNNDPDSPLPENFMELDWDRAIPLLREFVELAGDENPLPKRTPTG